ncbi:MAG: nitrogen regulation protein NR(I) [Rhizobiales bacterium]|nr:nitrogen regulation protein NR(I) [Hyphomicrobiales bacterium]NRB15073.1 nitrogen regulation protein NR(I) [Hyphomicrobiales bacterium]
MDEILIADDDAAIRTVITHALTRAGYRVRAASNASTLWSWVENGFGDLVISDVVMPDESGFDLLPRIKKRRPELPVIIMSAQNTVLTAITAAEKGAYEYLAKPFDLNELVAISQRAIQSSKTGAKKTNNMASQNDDLPLIGRSRAMQDIYRIIARLTQIDLTAMITGESGTGKELVARVLHDFGKRKNRPFVAVNMAAIPKDLIESELFGYEKGAFTGANSRNSGRFEQAEGGTLFLDEIGDMPMSAQTRLLRVLQEGEFNMVGGVKPIKTNIRIVAATHQDLTQLIRLGQFREDLYYRLNVVPINLPPLRARKDDIADLVNHFLVQAEKQGLGNKIFNAGALSKLRELDWPGNIRQLENLVKRVVALYPQDEVTEDIIEAEIAHEQPIHEPRGDASALSLDKSTRMWLENCFDSQEILENDDLYRQFLAEIEPSLLRYVLEQTAGNQIRASKILGLNRNTLRKKLKEYDIEIIKVSV